MEGRSFWTKEKPVLQYTGLLAALTGIFLAIPPQTNNKAALVTLSNVQFMLLTLTSVSVAFLLARVLNRVLSLAKSLKGRRAYFEEVISVGVLYIALWILFNLWGYLIATYSSSVKLFLQMSNFFLVIFFGSLYIYLIDLIYYIKRKWHKNIAGLLLITLITGVFVVILALTLSFLPEWKFSRSNFIRGVVYMAAILGYVLALFIRREHKSN